MKLTSAKPWKCDHCPKTFADAFALRSHHKKKHVGRKLNPTVKAACASNEEESMAMLAINAELDHAMGVENSDYDWLVEPYK